MSEHLSLYIVLAMTIIYGWIRAYSRYSRDWCGIRLLPRVLFQASPGMFLICLIYIELMHVLAFHEFQRYFVLISFAAAAGAEYMAGRTLHKIPQANAAPLTVATQIARKKIQLADKLEASGRCSETIINAISTSDLSARRKRSMIQRLQSPPTREQIFTVINEVGVAHIKVMVV